VTHDSLCYINILTYLLTASHAAGAVAEQAADRKCLKYAELSAAYEFQPVAVRSGEPLKVHFFIPADQCLGSKVQFSPLSRDFPN